MARAIQISIGGRTMWLNAERSDPQLHVAFEGRPVALEVPPPVRVNEPEPIGSKIKASYIGAENKVVTWMKIAPGQWITSELQGPNADSVIKKGWSQLQIYEVLGYPDPSWHDDPPPPAEIMGYGAVVLDRHGDMYARTERMPNHPWSKRGHPSAGPYSWLWLTSRGPLKILSQGVS